MISLGVLAGSRDFARRAVVGADCFRQTLRRKFKEPIVPFRAHSGFARENHWIATNQSLAENRPRFDVNLYLEDLRPQFDRAEYSHTSASRIAQN